ncbi:MAG: ArsA family ATPase [Acidimicrobiia bacterium]
MNAVPEVQRGAAAAALDLLGRQLLFVTGKGGTGKSTIAAAIGELAASLGKRTLMVEVDAKGNLTDFFEHPRVGFEPAEIRPGLWAMTMNTEDSLREYLQIFLKMGMVSRIGPLSSIFEFVANAAPGVKEILTVGKIAYEATLTEGVDFKWDLIVVDAAPTGRIVGQLDAPAAINELFEVGMVRTQTDWMREVLADPNRTALLIVATPEEMPVAETIELYHATEALDVRLAGVVVNRVLPELFTTAEEGVFDHLGDVDAMGVIEDVTGGPVGPVLEAARLAVTLRRTRVEHIRRLREGVPLPMLYVPYLFTRSHGKRATRLVADALAAEMGL